MVIEWVEALVFDVLCELLTGGYMCGTINLSSGGIEILSGLSCCEGGLYRASIGTKEAFLSWRMSYAQSSSEVLAPSSLSLFTLINPHTLSGVVQ